MFGALQQAAIVPLAGIIEEGGAAANPDCASRSFLHPGTYPEVIFQVSVSELPTIRLCSYQLSNEKS